MADIASSWAGCDILDRGAAAGLVSVTSLLLQPAALEDRIARQFQLFTYKGIAICRCGLQVDLVTIDNRAGRRMKRTSDQLLDETTYPNLAALLRSGGKLEVGEDLSVGTFARIR